MPVLHSASVVAMTVTLAAVSGCASQSRSAASTRPTTAASPSAQPPATPAPAPATTAPSSAPSSATPPATARTAADLTKALLSIEDLPPGFEVDPAGGSGSGKDDARVTSPKAACAPLVKILQDDQPVGSSARAGTSFSGGQDGPSIDQTLDSWPSRATAAAFVAGYRQAVQACSQVQVQVPGVGRSTVSVRPVSFGKIGDGLFAARLTAPAGPLQGLEVLQVAAQSGDVVVGMNFMSADPGDAEGATQDAVDKVDKELQTSSTTS